MARYECMWGSKVDGGWPGLPLLCTSAIEEGGKTTQGNNPSPKKLTNPGTTPITILAVNSDHGLSFAGEQNSDHGLSFLFSRDLQYF